MLRLQPLFWLFLLLFFSCRSARLGGGQDDGLIDIVFLHLNDVYEIAPLSDGTGGLARVAAVRQSLKTKNPNTYTILAGDFISPSVIGTLRHEGKRIRGRHMIDVLNTLGTDAVAFGNHEFDYDYDDLQARINESNFLWLGTNIRRAQGDTLTGPFFKQAPGALPVNCPDYTIVEFSDADGTKLRVGLWGVTVAANQKPYVRYTDPIETAQRMYERLQGECDVQIGLTHLDIEDDLRLAARLPEVPLIMGGHDHDNMLHRVGKTTVAKADANARTVYVHRLRYDKRKRIAQVRSELRRIDASIPAEPNTASVVARWEKIKEEALSNAGFNATARVTELRAPLDCREAYIRHQQAPVGQIILSAMLAAAKGKPDCAVLNSGSIRVDDVLNGPLTELDVVRMLPFGGGIREAEMRGTLLQRMLDAGWRNKGKGGYLQLAHIERDEAGGRWLIRGTPLEPARIYRVVMPDFLLTGQETNMDFLKAEPLPGEASGTSNPDILRIDKPDPNNPNDLRKDIRHALIHYWRQQ